MTTVLHIIKIHSLCKSIPLYAGIQTRLNHLTDDDSSASPQRLQQLQDFQFRALTHALSFPRVRRVVYSTCSVHAEENEVVVVKALEKSRVEDWGFRLVDALPKDVWKTRGMDGGSWKASLINNNTHHKDNSSSSVSDDDRGFHLNRCLRASPSTDFTNGFFVALFEREMIEDCSGIANDDAKFDNDDGSDDRNDD